MYRQIIAKNGIILSKEFNKLNSIEQKFNFWREKLRCLYDVDKFVNHPEIEYFRIIPKDNKEIAIINKLCLQKFQDNQDIETFEKLKVAFENKLEQTKNKLRLIEVQKRNIDNLVDEKKIYNYKSDKVLNDSFLEAYFDYYVNLKIPDLSNEVYSIKRLIGLNSGYIFACYHNYLDELLKQERNKDNVIKKEPEITVNQQLLILHYLGFINKLDSLQRIGYKNKNLPDKDGKDIIISKLLNSKQEYIRTKLSKNCNNIKTQNDIEFVRNIFEELKIQEIVELINNDPDNRFKEK